MNYPTQLHLFGHFHTLYLDTRNHEYQMNTFFRLTLTILNFLLASAHFYAKLSLAVVTKAWHVFGVADLAYSFRRRM